MKARVPCSVYACGDVATCVREFDGDVRPVCVFHSKNRRDLPRRRMPSDQQRDAWLSPQGGGGLKTMGIQLDQIKDPRLRQAIAGELAKSISCQPPCREAPVESKRIRQDHKPLLNKLENEALKWLIAIYPSAFFHRQALRFRLGNGIWFKPDLVAFLEGSGLWCWEVKGPHAFRGGFENLKVAAGLYPEVRFRLIWKANGQWCEQAVLA